jgi:hypothetical protein
MTSMVLGDSTLKSLTPSVNTPFIMLWQLLVIAMYSFVVSWVRVNQHPPVRHRLDGHYDSVVAESQLSYYLLASTR